MDLLTFLRLGKRLRRLVTVFVVALRPRLANEYYTIGVNIYFEFRIKSAFVFIQMDHLL